jgi:hypothetical protein
MKKADRIKIFEKYGGRCAYCGCELDGRWCVDHVEPIIRKVKNVGNRHVHKVTGEPYTDATHANDPDLKDFHENYHYVGRKIVPDGCRKPELDAIDNCNPSCFSCNNYKSTMGIKRFKEQIGELVGRLNKSFTQYKIAKRYGLVQETGIEVKFYFETIDKPVNL